MRFVFVSVRQRGLILESEIRFYLAEMVQAIEFLHNHNILHRDLKPENVLLNTDGHVAITDFGLGLSWISCMYVCTYVCTLCLLYHNGCMGVWIYVCMNE